MRPAGPVTEAGRILKGPRARVTRGDGTETKWRTAVGGCALPDRDYKGAPPTPIFREVGTNKVGGRQAAVRFIFLGFACVRDRRPQGPGRHSRPGTREPAPRSGGRPHLSSAWMVGFFFATIFIISQIWH